MINNEMIEFIEFLEKLGYTYTSTFENNKNFIVRELNETYLRNRGGLMCIKGSGRINISIRGGASVLSSLVDYKLVDISIIYPEAVSLFVLFDGVGKNDRTKITDKFKELSDRIINKEVEIQW